MRFHVTASDRCVLFGLHRTGTCIASEMPRSLRDCDFVGVFCACSFFILDGHTDRQKYLVRLIRLFRHHDIFYSRKKAKDK
jgi:hypothetical protein